MRKGILLVVAVLIYGFKAEGNCPEKGLTPPTLRWAPVPASQRGLGENYLFRFLPGEGCGWLSAKAGRGLATKPGLLCITSKLIADQTSNGIAKRNLSFGEGRVRPIVDSLHNLIQTILRPYILKEASWAMQQEPVTITAEGSPRSAGGKHDFYSEGDYWWPNPANPDGSYIQKDRLTNPQNFTAHRLAMIRFSRIVGALASAYKITHQDKYVKQAMLHIRAWFINPETLMNPNLLYAQAIKGVATGRGIGIIDTIQLMEVVQGILAMEASAAMDKQTVTQTKEWFSKYLDWLTTHQYGKDEMNAKNNHGTCWVMQVACFARFTGNDSLLSLCRARYKEVLLPGQMAADGSFPLELKRTKPYGYSIFNLDAMATICNILSTAQDNLWDYQTNDGRSIKKGVAFLAPYLAHRSKWPYAHDVMYWDNWPVAGPSLVFGAVAYQNRDWLSIWQKLEHNPQEPEVIRNLPVRHPLIWLN